MDRSTAAQEFALMLFREGVETGVQAFFDAISNPAGHQREKRERMRRWYDNQSEGNQQTFRLAVGEAMVLAVFGIAVHLDGDTGGVQVGDRNGQFSVALKLWREGANTWKDTPEETVEICPTKKGEDVHDLFLDLVDEWEKAQSW